MAVWMGIVPGNANLTASPVEQYPTNGFNKCLNLNSQFEFICRIWKWTCPGKWKRLQFQETLLSLQSIVGETAVLWRGQQHKRGVRSGGTWEDKNQKGHLGGLYFDIIFVVMDKIITMMILSISIISKDIIFSEAPGWNTLWYYHNICD